MHHQDGEVGEQFDHIIAVGNAVERVQRDTVKAELLRFKIAVGVVGRARKRTAADRRDIHAASAILQAVNITQEHHHIRHEVVTEHDGLGSLEMGVAGHDSLFILLRLIGQGEDQALYVRFQLVDAVHQVHSQVERNLIVS